MHRRLRPFFCPAGWLAALLAVVAGLLAPLSGAGAQPMPQPALTASAPTLPDVAELRARFDKLPASADSNADMRRLLAQSDAIAADANRLIAARTPQLNDLNARLGELGSAPPPGGTEDADITRRRAALTKERNAVDADIRLARLVVVDAQQRGTELLNKRRELFTAQLSERAASPLGRDFWSDIAQAWPEDSERLAALGEEMQTGLAQAAQDEHRAPLLASLLAVLLAITLGNVLAERGLVRLATRVLPGQRLRRSLLVIAIVGTNMLVVALALRWLTATFDAHGLLGEQTRPLMRMLSSSLLFMTFVISLGRALLSNARPSWRLPPVPDAMALRLRFFPPLTALVLVVAWLPGRVNTLVEASLPAEVAQNAFSALMLTLLMCAFLLRLREPRTPAPALKADPDAAASAPAPTAPDAAPAGEAAPPPRRAAEPEAQHPLWVPLLLGALSLVLIAVGVLVGLGYVALASLVASQLVWSGIVFATFYVLFKFADDLFMAVVSSKSSMGHRLQRGFDFAPATLDQAAVVLSAVARVGLFFYMVITLVAPLGTDPAEVFQRSGQYGSGLKIGEFELVPASLLGAIGVLVGGFIALRVGRHWLRERYLPTTRLEPGMQASIATLLGYVGAILVVALALSALGISINRIAWIASALSVGIGFGLQAIVQNFISGLILLAERPVKVGDWVVLGTTEGDVRRINVRATEVQLGDRSTVIVPNSEFITKTVRNLTLDGAEGRVLIRLPMPLETDTRQVRELMLAASAAHAGVLAQPAASVSLEGIEQGNLMFQWIAYTASPRQAAGVKSDLLFAILEQLKQAGLALSAPTMVLSAPPAASAGGAAPDASSGTSSGASSGAPPA